jgi:hypothetical protein
MQNHPPKYTERKREREMQIHREGEKEGVYHQDTIYPLMVDRGIVPVRPQLLGHLFLGFICVTGLTSGGTRSRRWGTSWRSMRRNGSAPQGTSAAAELTNLRPRRRQRAAHAAR